GAVVDFRNLGIAVSPGVGGGGARADDGDLVVGAAAFLRDVAARTAVPGVEGVAAVGVDPADRDSGVDRHQPPGEAELPVGALGRELRAAVVGAGDHVVEAAADQHLVCALEHDVAVGAVDVEAVAGAAEARIADLPQRAEHLERAALQTDPVPADDGNHIHSPDSRRCTRAFAYWLSFLREMSGSV